MGGERGNGTVAGACEDSLAGVAVSNIGVEIACVYISDQEAL